MKKGFKRTFVLGAAFAAAASIVGCARKLYGPPPGGYDRELTGEPEAGKKTIEIETEGLSFQILESVNPDILSAEFDEIDGHYGAREFLDRGYKAVIDEENGGMRTLPEAYVSYTVTHYPDYADSEWAVTGIVIKDDNVKVFGKTVSSDIRYLDQILAEKGFGVDTLGDGPRHLATCGDISISYGNGEIRITAEVTNREGIVY